MKYQVKNLTLEEKMKLLCGADSWHNDTANGKLPQLHLSDGPNGLRKEDLNGKIVKATSMPAISVLANTWSEEMAYLDGATIADDCIENDVDVLLAPGVNMKRIPNCGRNFEYFSEDPFLAGKLAKSYIQGVQDKGIGVSLKHYCCNNCEVERFTINSEVDERTLREIYLAAFEEAVEANPTTVMCSYNPINGVYGAENRKLLKDILRDEFGYNGVIVSDWGAYRSAYKSLKATLDLVMPYDEKHFGNLQFAYEKGLITETEINESVERILELIEFCKNSEKKTTTTKEQRHENAVKIAEEGIVLLKNNGVLPLKQGSVKVVGVCADNPPIGGGGSAAAETEYKQEGLVSLLKNKLGDKADVSPVEGFIFDKGFSLGLKKGIIEAYESDATLICVGRNESEAADMPTTRLTPEQENAIIHIAKQNKNTIVALYTGTYVDMSAWINEVNAVVFVGYAGEGVNEALSSILVGEISPSGKLNESFPLCENDALKNVNDGFSIKYEEGIFIGYRRYEKCGIPVQFPFGHGLSYANFEYSDLEIEKIGDTDFIVSYTIENRSDMDAKEISQVYVKDVHCMVSRPEKELKGFSKDFIKAGERKRISLKLNFRSFAYYNTSLEKWHVENGWFEIYVGASSLDIRLSNRIKMELPEETQQSQS